jgi:hypothetical protein
MRILRVSQYTKGIISLYASILKESLAECLHGEDYSWTRVAGAVNTDVQAPSGVTTGHGLNNSA